MEWQVRAAVSPGRAIAVDPSGVTQFLGSTAEAWAFVAEAQRCEAEVGLEEYDRSGQSINPPGSGGQF